MAGSLRLSDNQFHITRHKAGHRKSPPTITAETTARHDEKTGWHSEDVWRRHWTQTGRGRRGTGCLTEIGRHLQPSDMFPWLV